MERRRGRRGKVVGTPAFTLTCTLIAPGVRGAARGDAQRRPERPGHFSRRHPPRAAPTSPRSPPPRCGPPLRTKPSLLPAADSRHVRSLPPPTRSGTTELPPLPGRVPTALSRIPRPVRFPLGYHLRAGPIPAPATGLWGVPLSKCPTVAEPSDMLIRPVWRPQDLSAGIS